MTVFYPSTRLVPLRLGRALAACCWLLALVLGAGYAAQAQVLPQPLVIGSGFSDDVVANGSGQTGGGNSTTADADGSGNYFTSVDYTQAGAPDYYHPNIGLPIGRSFVSIGTPNVRFSLASYSASNSLRLTDAAPSGTLTLATPAPASVLYVLATCGSGPRNVTFTVTFADNTTQSFVRAVPDWYATTSPLNNTSAAYYLNGRLNSGNSFDNLLSTNNPRFFQLVLPLNDVSQAKNVVSIGATKTVAGGYVHVMAVSAAAPVYPTVPLTLPATGTAATPSAFGQDVIANGASQSSPANSTTADTDGASYYLASADYTTTAGAGLTQGLPLNGAIPSLVVPGMTYQLLPYTGINALQVRGATSGTVTFTTGRSASEVYVLANTVLTTGSTAAGTLTVNFSDGTTHAFPVTFYNWYTTTATAPTYIGYSPNGRVQGGGTTNTIQNYTNNTPNFFEFKLALDATELAKTITGVTATGTSATILSVLGVSVNPGTSANCATAPSGVSALSSAATACPSFSFNLTLNGVPALPGYTYQWQYLNSSSAWTNLSTTASTTEPVATNPTTANCVVTNQTYATSYRCAVTCANGGFSTSGAVAVSQNAPINCFCNPLPPTSSASCATYGTITGVAINNGAGLSQTGISCPAAPYSSFGQVLAATATASLTQATAYTLSVTVSNASRVAAWLDVNQNGVFDSGEYITSNTATAAGTITLSIPAALLTGATLGNTKLRIRSERNTATVLSTSTAACSTTAYGETLDYVVTIAAATACSGVPAASTLSTSNAGPLCGGTAFTLTASAPVGVTGLSYQFQSSPSGANNFSNLGSAQTTNTYAVSTQTAATDYRVLVTCTNSSLTSVSNVVTVAQNPFYNCYCVPGSDGTNEYITSVTLPGTNGFTSTSNPTPNPATANGNSAGYTDYTTNAALTTTLTQGATYNGGIGLTVRSNAANSTGGLWIDYDHSGTFDASEFTAIGSSSATATLVSFTANLTIPGTALTGATRVRVRWRNSAFTGTAADACATGWFGEVEDYLVTIAASTNCSAPPSSVTASASVASACSNGSFTLSASGISTTLGGYTYQWQSSPAGANTFTAISGATTQTYTVTSQTAATDYRLIVGCQYGGSPVTSNVVSVGQNNFANCYCAPAYTNGCGSYGQITNVQLNTLNYTTGCAASPYYTVVPASTATTSVNGGSSYTLKITNAGIASTFGVWIDYNQNGTFEASEFVYGATGSTSGVSTTITIPTTALGGTTRMRVRSDSYTAFTSASDPCTTLNYGEAEDYTITIVAPTACTGTPAAPGASASTANACVGSSFTLTGTNPSNASGLTYQWQSSPAGANSFTNISGATALTYTVTSQTAATDYRLVVTCTNSNLSSNSNVVSVGQNPFYNCYCTPVTSGIGTDGITNVTLTTPAGTLNNSSSATNTSPYYTDYSSTQNAGTLPIPTLYVNGTATLSVTMGSDSQQYSGAWIDFDHSGTFDTGEFFTLGTNAGSNGTSTFTITVPASALSGLTKMRVRGGNDLQLLSAQSCTAASSATNYGEVEDYLVTIAAPVACTGTPATTVASASVSTVCAGTSFTLSATGIAPGTTGLTYQWQSSPAGTNSFTALSGATTNPYTVTSQTAATDYRLVVTCTASSQSSTSNVVSVGQNGFANCYCTPTGGTCANEWIQSVTFNTLSNPNTGCTGTGGYNDYTGNATYTTTLTPGSTYPITLSLQINSNPAAAGVWIDYDHSGTFDASEFTQVYSNTTLTGSNSVTGTVNITVPTSALTGATRMRVRSANSSIPLNATGACQNGFYGEVEDYLVTISAPNLVISTPGQTVPAGAYNSITVQNGGQGTLAGNVTVASNVTVQSGGTLNDGCAIISGAGTFTLAAGGTLGICNASGIMSTGATGAVQVTGTRSFSIDASYVYNGTTIQNTGTGLPGQVRNLTTTNSNTVTLTSSTSATQVVTVGGSGNLALNGQALTLLSNASGTALIVNSNTGLVTGSTGVAQRYLATANQGLGYRHYSTPVSGNTVADLATGTFSPVLTTSYNGSATPAATTPFPTVFGYDQSRLATATNNLTAFDKGWYVPAGSGAPLAVGQGYTVNLAGTELVDFAGTFNSGSQPVSLSRGSGTDAGLALVGNPYPAPIDWSLVNAITDRPGVDGSIYVFASSTQYGGSYRSYTNGQGGNPIVPMGQGFFVRVTPGQSSGTLTFRNAHRLIVPDATPMQRLNDPRPLVVLELGGAGQADPLYAYAEAGSTPALDREFDAQKLSNPSGLNLSSAASSGERLAIDGRPAFTASTELPLQVGVPAAGTYTFTATQLHNLPAGLSAYLRDAATGQTLLLVVGQSYSFPVTATQAQALLTGRFTLLFRTSGALAATPAALAAAVSVYPNPAGRAGFTVGVPAVAGATQVQAELLNTLGQVVVRQSAPLPAGGATFTMPTAKLATGVYVLRLTAGEATATKRVTIE